MIKDVIYLIKGEEGDGTSYSLRKLRFFHKMKRKINRMKRSIKAPICFVLGHSSYQDNYWNYSRIYCNRCNYMKSLWESKRASKTSI